MSSLVIAPYRSGTVITGNTFDVKDILKQFGGRWNHEIRGWIFQTEAVEQDLRMELEASGKISQIKEQSVVDLFLVLGLDPIIGGI